MERVTGLLKFWQTSYQKEELYSDTKTWSQRLVVDWMRRARMMSGHQDSLPFILFLSGGDISILHADKCGCSARPQRL